MPCGGVFPCKEPDEKEFGESANCFFCNKPGCRHFYEEWDAFIHTKCFIDNLMDKDGEAYIAIDHKHTVVLDFSLEK